MTQFSSFNELAAYLMVAVARADGHIHYLEQSTLQGQLKWFTEDEHVLQRAMETYNPNLKIEDVLKTNEPLIRAASDEARQALMASLFGIVNSDGRVQAEEMAVMKVIRETLSVNL